MWTAAPLVVFYIRSFLDGRWVIWRRGQWSRGARNLSPKAGEIWHGLSLDGKGEFTGARGGWIPQTPHPGIPFYSVWLSISLWPCHCHIQATWSSSCFYFQGLHQLHQASILWWEVECLWLKADHLGTKGLQWVEFMVAGAKAEGLYDIL